MAKTAEHPRSPQEVKERRCHPREKIQEVSYIELLDGRNGGVVLNISETGLLLQSALKLTDEVVSRLRFRLPASDRSIEARARLVWLGESGKEAGVQFIELSEDDRARIEEWVAQGGLPRYPSDIPEEGIAWEQAFPEPAATAPSTVGTPPRPVQRNDDWSLPSFARPGGVTKPSWWRIGQLVLALAIAAVLLGLKYSPRLPRLPILDVLNETHNSTVSPVKARQSPAPNAGTHSAAAPPQTPSAGIPPEGGVAPASSPRNESSPPQHAPKATSSTFGGLVTQTLSPRSPATAHNARGIRAETRKQKQPRTGSGLGSSDTSFPSPAVAPSSSQVAILVGAPAAGSPPARVILETEPVSASSKVAVTASRSILVPGSPHPTEQILLGKLISHVSPVYPADAEANEIEGTVRVRAFIDLSGKVQSVRLLSGPPALAPTAMNAIRKWRFGSTLLNGQAIESQADVSVFFRLH